MKAVHVGEMLLKYCPLHALFDALAFQVAPCLINVGLIYCNLKFADHILEVKLGSLDPSMTLGCCKHDQRYFAD